MEAFDPRHIEMASASDVGRRRATNQDAFGSADADSGARLLIVADGMGGHAGGATASRLAVEAIVEVFQRSSEPAEATLRRALETANARIHDESQRDASLAGMGTTGVALAFTPDGAAWVAHVGDSRAYRLRDGRLEALTADHSLVGELLRRNMITPEEAENHPRRHEVLRSIGVESRVQIDLAPVDVRPGDRFLLCSDGLCGVVDDAEIGAVLAREVPEAAVQQLVAEANARGGPDNITVQIARVPEAAPRQAVATGTIKSWHVAAAVLLALVLVIGLVIGLRDG
jgi:PPM family protein phosphatase